MRKKQRRPVNEPPEKIAINGTVKAYLAIEYNFGFVIPFFT